MISIDEDEAKLYDRQIRLWGLNAQQRIKSHTVFVDCLTFTTTEILKNLVLAGIKSVTIVLDPAQPDIKDSFFINSSDIPLEEEFKKNVSDLNPRVSIITVLKENFTDSLIAEVNTIVSTSQLHSWNEKFDYFHKINPNANIILCSSLGSQAISYFYFGTYEFQEEETIKDASCSNSSIVKCEEYPKVDKFIKMDLKTFYKSFKKQTSIPIGFILSRLLFKSPKVILKDWEAHAEANTLNSSLIDQNLLDSLNVKDCVSIGAIFGGFVSQVILKAVSKNKPLGGNVFFFNSLECSGQFDWYPKPEESGPSNQAAQEITIDEIL